MKETKKLFKLVQKYTGVEFLNESYKEVTEDDLDLNYVPKRISKHNDQYQPDAVLVRYNDTESPF